MLFKNLLKSGKWKNIFQFIGQIIPNLSRSESERPFYRPQFEVWNAKLLFRVWWLCPFEHLRKLLNKYSGAKVKHQTFPTPTTPRQDTKRSLPYSRLAIFQKLYLHTLKGFLVNNTHGKIKITTTTTILF